MKNNSAFTLVEMVLVIVIIGILAGTVAFTLAGRSEEARITAARADISSKYGLVLDLFEQDVGRYPTDEEGLAALMENPGVTNWKGPYLKKSGVKPDPWGTPYVYARDPENPNLYTLSSAGPDEQIGNDDDITE